MAITSWSDKVAGDMAKLVKEGINSFKFFMAYKVGRGVEESRGVEAGKGGQNNRSRFLRIWVIRTEESRR
jgi:hypothetical protein